MEKIAILGGGVSAMTAACYLTEQKDWQQNYQIDVYQLGWRIGGKGASGRNAKMGQRIEEHGLHVWFGAYVNSFKTLQTVYKDLDRPVGAPLATFDDAFKPHSFIALEEYIKDTWQSWGIEFPELPGNPADGDLDPDFWDLVRLIYYWLKQFIKQMVSHRSEKRQVALQEADLPWYQHIASVVKREYAEFKEDVAEFTEAVQNFIDMVTDDDEQANHTSSLDSWLNKLRKWLHDEFDDLLEDNADLRHLYIGADLAITTLKGIIADDVYHNGFGYLNQWDFREWLRRHGADENFSVDAAPVRGFYDLVFGYEKGDFSRPNVEAGVALLAIIRIALCYSGGVMWKMQAGMGDTIFTPIYELLKRRGVNFHYFNKVDALLPDALGTDVEEILITEQVALAPGLTEYQPLVDVKGLGCWPSAPLYEQIAPEQAELLKAHNINLESSWSNWGDIYQQAFGQPLPHRKLVKGEDFDKVIFGISVAALEHLCPQLLTLDNKLRICAEKVEAVATQAYQVWTDVPFSGLGWTDLPADGEEPILSGFVEPYDTWAAMNQLLCREDWPAPTNPKNVAYFCSAMPVDQYPPTTEHGFPAHMKAIAKHNAIQHLTQDMYNLWPNIAEKGSFDWSALTDPDEQTGELRFNAQYWRSNVDPSERYVLSLKNTSQYRLNTHDTCFENLYITGDWINTGVNAGCVEAAVMAGMETSRAICGYPEHINGEKGFLPYSVRK